MMGDEEIPPPRPSAEIGDEVVNRIMCADVVNGAGEGISLRLSADRHGETVTCGGCRGILGTSSSEISLGFDDADDETKSSSWP